MGFSEDYIYDIFNELEKKSLKDIQMYFLRINFVDDLLLINLVSILISSTS